MEMCYAGALEMPSNYALMCEEEMTYVEGGGTVTITIKKSTIQGVIGTISGAASGWAINAALDSLAIPIATAIELGTAGAGTLAVGAFLIAWHGAAAGIASGIAGSIVGTGVSKIYTGGDQSVSITKDFLPNFSVTI